ncbi:PROTEIN KINASE putative-RELATED [Salix purpurea]|uniref:PROTEIN KINASE putative-RELATED n=1 Tax=Salix purpurea TaxID=77065 RepID=A0A9Q0W8P2_SALPP|nr:PROTEIN KINASE putative-RELATED [Salix purpurea]
MNRIGGMTTCWGTKKDKKVNEETAFIRNGSKLLDKLVNICDGKFNSIRRFSATELEKATNNYDLRKLLTYDLGNELYKVAFLHAAFARPIVFRNIKPLNILLDDNHEAKLSDFSYAISIPEDDSHVRDVDIIGAPGLIAPEYWTTGDFNEKQDVFNFGGFLLMLLSGQKLADYSRPEDEIFLQNHVEKCIEDDRLNEVIDSTIIAEGAWPGKEQQLQAFAALALRCTSEVEEDRPSIIDVSKELRKMHRSAISCRQQQG